MKHSKITVTALLVGISLVTGCRKAPQSVWTSEGFDFGRFVERVEKLEHSFTLTNPTDEECIIDRTAVSCGCVSSLHGPQKIAPRGRLEVPITVDTRAIAGKITHGVSLYSRSFPRGRLDFTVTMEIVRQGILSPATVDLGEVEPGKTIPCQSTLSITGDPGSLTAKYLTEGVRAVIEPIRSTESHPFLIKMEVETPTTVGPFFRDVDIQRTLHGKIDTFELRVIGIVAPELSVSPTYLVVRGTESKEIAVAARSKSQSVRPTIDGAIPGLSADWVDSGGGTWRIRVRSDATAESGSVRIPIVLGSEKKEVVVDIVRD